MPGRGKWPSTLPATPPFDSVFSQIPHMTYQQYRTARRLVHECCNYDCGNCLLLDNHFQWVLFLHISPVFLCPGPLAPFGTFCGTGGTVKCCNYDCGNCLLLDNGEECVCPQSITYSLICKWFRAAVLPLDAGLCAALFARFRGWKGNVSGPH